MRIVIDMQGAQSTGSRSRGIGRYTLSIAKAILRNRGKHEVLLALSSLFPDTIEQIRAEFDGLLSQQDIHVWHTLSGVSRANSTNEWRRLSAEAVREAFLRSLNPDIILVTSLFEGFGDDAVTSIKRFSADHAWAAILYDLIPLIHRKPYLDNPLVNDWYMEKIQNLRRADLCLTISDSSRKEGVEHLGLPYDSCVNISTDAEEHFRKCNISPEILKNLRKKYGLTRNIVMYTGGIDHRKNIEGLIRAYARLSPELRKNHQLAIVCSVNEDNNQRLQAIAKHHGLNSGEVILTGFVSEEDLISLYNLCTLFVFPSWHEGFGLPALEAMRCGAPVIGANSSSLPEVIGLPEALFDPHSDESIACAIDHALTDAEFRNYLIEHCKVQARKFSWDDSAHKALKAMENLISERHQSHIETTEEYRRHKLAYVSPLPPERSGIADYSAELVPVLAQHYEIEVIVDQPHVADEWIKKNFPIRSTSWFMKNANHFDRVLYHFGNSASHKHMFHLLKAIPGVVVLHDFYLSNLLNYIDAIGYAPGCFRKHLFYSHGYVGLVDSIQANNQAGITWKYPCSRSVIESSIGTIVHSENSLRLASEWYGDNKNNWSVIPLMRFPISASDRTKARKYLGISETDFIVCSFGVIGPTKLSHRLMQAWLDSELSRLDNSRLIFVGQNSPDDYGIELIASIKKLSKNNNIQVTGWVDRETYQSYLAAADLGVQLRTLSRGETSAAVLDCMNHSLPTIVNNNGSMADLDDAAVWKLPDNFDTQELTHALETLWRDGDRATQLGKKARIWVLENHNPVKCAALYKIAIEEFYERNRNVLNDLVSTIGKFSTHQYAEHELAGLAATISRTFPPMRRAKQLLVDISELVMNDAKTGIQRVVRSIIREWLLNPPTGWKVEPVYATTTEPYRYARQFIASLLNAPSIGLLDEPVDYAPGDIFFVLDLHPQVQTAQAGFYQNLRQQGVTVKFMVYDLLCILLPDNFAPAVGNAFREWLNVVGESDGALCISKTVAEELDAWMQGKHWNRCRPFVIEWNHLGADVHNSIPTQGLPDDSDFILANIERRPSFLMVGTLEPRKGHTQVLDAFDSLWREGQDINLVIVGKVGWMVENLLERLHSHSELNCRLILLNGISDQYLEKVYCASTCLISASYGEGFGLPLIEAAQFKLPIIARDIPVHREVAGMHAYYFCDYSPEPLAQVIRMWLTLFRLGQHPRSNAMPWLTWHESAQLLAGKVLNRQHNINQAIISQGTLANSTH